MLLKFVKGLADFSFKTRLYTILLGSVSVLLSSAFLPFSSRRWLSTFTTSFRPRRSLSVFTTSSLLTVELTLGLALGIFSIFSHLK